MLDYDRFGGIARLYGEPALQAFTDAHIVVLGIGGVGSWCAEALARSGVGEITLVDLDEVCVSNTNRQLHTTSDTIGMQKTAVMADRLMAINPNILVNTVEAFVDRNDVGAHIPDNTTYVIDAIDHAKTKAPLLAYLRKVKIPAITIGSSGGKRDPRLITSCDLRDTIQDTLLARVRSELKDNHRFSRNLKTKFRIEAVYSPEPMTYPDGKGGTTAKRPHGDEIAGLDCSSGFGSITMVTASFGFVAVSRALESIAEQAFNSPT